MAQRIAYKKKMQLCETKRNENNENKRSDILWYLLASTETISRDGKTRAVNLPP